MQPLSIRTAASSLFKLLVALTISLPVHAQTVHDGAQAVLNYQDRRAIFEPVQARYGMVASDHILASRIGSEILQSGGNAVDAAVATAFALAVVLPYAGNLGGGGFALIQQAGDQGGQTRALDFRETAPSGAHRDMFLDPQAAVIPGMSIESTASVGVPGTVAGLLAALESAGTMPRQAVIEPALLLARQGFEVSQTLAGILASHARHLYKSPASREVFFKPRAGEQCNARDCSIEQLMPLEQGDILRQPALARTLGAISEHGAAGFYEGWVADAIVQTVNAGQGRMSPSDLSNYTVRWREPVRGHYRGLEILSMPPPSSGGVHLVQMLNILSNYQMASYGYGSAASLHVMTEAARRAYADRATYMGDPDFVDVPIDRLTSGEYAKELAAGIQENQATPSKQIRAPVDLAKESTETTHLSVVDQWANMVSLTTTLNLNFGSGWMAEGTGVLLNNQMDDFAAKPGSPNAFGLIGSAANQIEAGKRPLSSMTPTIVLRDGRPWLATGTPGGSRIITTVVQIIVNVADHSMNIAAAGAVPRTHHQWLPDRIDLEPGYSPDTIRILQKMGHQVAPSRAFGRVQTVSQDDAMSFGASDPRSTDGAAIGPITATGKR